MRIFLTFIAIVMALPVGAAGAQETPDVPAIADRIVQADTERLLMGLNTPIPEDLLPEGFSQARPMTGTLLRQQRETFENAFVDTTGSMVYTVAYDPTATGATPEAPEEALEGSPAPRAPQWLFASSTLSYLIFSDPVDVSYPDIFAASVQMAMGSEAEAGTVDFITLGGAPALVIRSEAVVNAIEMHTQWIAVPVGKVIVVAMVMSSQEMSAGDDLQADNEALALAGVTYLDEVTDDES